MHFNKFIVLLAPGHIQILAMLTVECDEGNCRVCQEFAVKMLEPLVFG